MTEETDDTEKVYLAGPIMHADDGGHGWRNRIIDGYPDAFDWVNPLDKFDGGEASATVLPEELAADYETDEGERVITDRQIVEADVAAVWDCDAILIGYPERVPTWGTPMENGLVWSRRATGQQRAPTKPIALWHGIPEEDLSPWLRYHTTYRTEYMNAAIEYLQTVLGENVYCIDCLNDAGASLEKATFNTADSECERCGHNIAIETQSGALW